MLALAKANLQATAGERARSPALAPGRRSPGRDGDGPLRCVGREGGGRVEGGWREGEGRGWGQLSWAVGNSGVGALLTVLIVRGRGYVDVAHVRRLGWLDGWLPGGGAGISSCVWANGWEGGWAHGGTWVG